MANDKSKKVFISHATKDEVYVQKIVDLFEDIGLTEEQVVCSSIPGYGIPLGEDIYDWLAKQFQEFDLHVLLILSDNYYNSIACQNEMGAVWVLKTKYTTILLPKFEYRDIKGAVNPNQIGIKLDGDKEVLKQYLNELKDTLVKEFNLVAPSSSKWERNRKTFLDAIESIPENTPSAECDSVVMPMDQNEDILTPDAEELLVHAAKDPSGRVLATKMLRGIAITANSRAFCSPGRGVREEARWTGALEELENYGFVEAATSKRTVFTVTRDGFDYADKLMDKEEFQKIVPAEEDIEKFL